MAKYKLFKKAIEILEIIFYLLLIIIQLAIFTIAGWLIYQIINFLIVWKF